MIHIKAAYKAFCKTRFPLPTERQVADLEDGLGIQLPPDYREFILRYNGGFFNEPDIVPPSDNCPKDCLTSLYGIGALHPSAELHPLRAFDFEDNDPVVVLSIGYTLMGNLLWMITHEEDRGSIGLKKAWSDDNFFLAEGIEEFFTLLRQPEEA